MTESTNQPVAAAIDAFTSMDQMIIAARENAKALVAAYEAEQKALAIPAAVETVKLGKAYAETGRRGDTLYDRLAATLGGSPRAKQPSLASDQKFWALRNVTLQVPKGQVLGIVGRNGSGKSTLMKILSRITAPTEGQAIVRGRVGALLEIGSCFHPELSGRENIRFAGALMGMTDSEVENATNAIVGFAAIGRFLEAPVKFYSIGMYMRLAFAVSAHLSNEVLLLDEILAVGDEAFQEKCRDRIASLCGEGRTVLIISHIGAILKQSCQRLIVLEAGEIAYDGDPTEGLDIYHRTILPYPQSREAGL